MVSKILRAVSILMIATSQQARAVPSDLSPHPNKERPGKKRPAFFHHPTSLSDDVRPLRLTSKLPVIQWGQ
jgi:hypothetical protein